MMLPDTQSIDLHEEVADLRAHMTRMEHQAEISAQRIEALLDRLFGPADVFQEEEDEEFDE